MSLVLAQAFAIDWSRAIPATIFGVFVGLLAWSMRRNIQSIDRRQDDCEALNRAQSADIAALRERVSALEAHLDLYPRS